MSDSARKTIRVAIACGGTGGHLFPGLALGEELLRRNCAVTLMVSHKEVDQQAVKHSTGFEIVSLPAVGLVRGGGIRFLRGFVASYRLARREFKQRLPQAVLAMGGFTSAPPVLAGKRLGARTFLHESNTVAGRANRWLSWVVDLVFLGFPSAAARLHCRGIQITGTPVRRVFSGGDPAWCRSKLDLDPARPVVLVMGGSQGAGPINELVSRALPQVARMAPDWQWLHFTGTADAGRVKAAYDAAQLKAVIRGFCAQMELALGAATAAVSRAGASSLAELAATQTPAVLIPYPTATDNHQFYNARAYAETGAAMLLEQCNASPGSLVSALRPLMNDTGLRQRMREALRSWNRPQAAGEIAETLLAAVSDPACLKNPFSQKAAFA